MNEKTFNAIDLMKFLLSIAVVASHVNPMGPTKLQPEWYKMLVGFAVPFFFMTSGFLLFYGMHDIGKHECLERIGKQFKRSITLYLFWSLIYLPVALWGYYDTHATVKYALENYLRYFFFKGEHYLSWPLWYLLSSIYVLGFYWCMVKLGIEKRYIFLAALAFYCLFQQIPWMIKHMNELSGIRGWLALQFKLSFSDARLGEGFLYITLGAILAEFYSDYSTSYVVKKWGGWNGFLMLFALVSLMLASLQSKNFVTTVLYRFMAVYHIVKMNLPSGSIWQYCRHTSTVIYFTHMLVVFVEILLWGKPARYGMKSFCIVLGCTLLLSVVIILLRKGKLNKYLKVVF